MLSTTLTIALTLIPTLCIGHLTDRDVTAASLPTCAITCAMATAAISKCTNPADLTCACTDTDYRAKMLACMQKGCDPASLATAFGVSQSLCAGVTTPTPPEVVTPPSTPVTPSTPSTPVPSPVAPPVENNPVTPKPSQPSPVTPAPQNETGGNSAPVVVVAPDQSGGSPGAVTSNSSELTATMTSTLALIPSSLPAANASIVTPTFSASGQNATSTPLPSSNSTDSTDNASSLLGSLSATLVAAAFYAAVSLPSIL